MEDNEMTVFEGKIVDSNDSGLKLNDDIISYRKEIIQRYREKRNGVSQMLRSGVVSLDDAMMLIAQEILEESESLLGNELITTEDGDLEKATAISVKRTDVLKSVADILAKKRELNQKDADVDLNGPAFMLFQKMCFDKMMKTLEELSFDREMVQLILKKWVQSMENWGKELKNELEKNSK